MASLKVRFRRRAGKWNPEPDIGIDLCRPRFYLAAAEPVPRRGLDLFLEVVLC